MVRALLHFAKHLSVPKSNTQKTLLQHNTTQHTGMDVARKVVILARAAGVSVELSDLNVESLVPAALAGGDVSADEFLAKLPEVWFLCCCMSTCCVVGKGGGGYRAVNARRKTLAC
jgi:hypothetical protein